MKINESQLKQIVAESVKKVLDESLFGINFIDGREFFTQINNRVKQYGFRYTFRKSQPCLIDMNSEDSHEIPLNIPVPKASTSGLMGTGTSGYNKKQADEYIKQVVARAQRIRENYKKSQEDWEAYKAESDRIARERYNSPEQVAKRQEAERQRRYKEEAEWDRRYRNQMRIYTPTGDVNDYRG